MSSKAVFFSCLTLLTAIPTSSFAQTSQQLLDCIRYVTDGQDPSVNIQAASACQDVTDLSCVRYLADGDPTLDNKLQAAIACKAPIVQACPMIITQVVDVDCIKLVTDNQTNGVDPARAAGACRRNDLVVPKP